MLWIKKLLFKNKKAGGFIPSKPDDRDFKYKKVGDSLLKEVDLRPLLSPVTNQYNYESCTANATCTILDYNLKYKKQNVSWDYNSSEAYLWYWTRFLEGTQKNNVGVQPRNVFKAIHKYGFVPESEWNMGKAFETPPFKVNFLGKSNLLYIKQLPGYYSIGANKSNTVDLCMDALNDFVPLTFAFPVDKAFKGNKGELISSVDNDVFYHDMVVVGYNKDGFIVRNSWGSKWGDKGYSYISFDVFKKYAFDIWCLK